MGVFLYIMTNEEIERFYHIYYSNEKKIHELDNTLFQPTSSAQEWTELLKLRSIQLRNIYAENMRELEHTLTPIIQDPHLLTLETAQLLLRKICQQNIYTTSDFMMNRPVLESLLRFYTDAGEPLMVCRVYAKLGNCYTLSLFETEYREEFDYMKKAAYNLNNYEIYDLRMRESAIVGNYNYFVVNCVLTTVPYETLLKQAEELIAFLHTDIVQADTGHLASLNPDDYIYLIEMNLIEPYYGKPVPDLDTIHKLRFYAQQLLSLEKNWKDTNLLVYAKYWEYQSQEISGNAYFDYLYQLFFSNAQTCTYFETVSSIENASKMPASFYIAADVVQAIRYTDYSAEKKAMLYNRIIQKFISDSNLAPKGSFDILLSDYMQRFVYSLDAYCGPKEVLLNTIVNLSIRQQIQTYLHSVMVKNIALLILDDIFTQEPEIFLGYKGYQCLCILQARREEIREYVRHAALLHDLGKIRISSIINLQCRKLTDHEFGEIQKHPSYGQRIIHRFSCLREYSDVILGHHKSFDGKTGYPASFDNCKSPYKIVIDLISIADSIDAATDILGRNYTTGKSFDRVMQELLAGASTRYSDVLVNYIASHPSLKRRISQLVSEERLLIYQEIYTNVIGLANVDLKNGCDIHH